MPGHGVSQKLTLQISLQVKSSVVVAAASQGTGKLVSTRLVILGALWYIMSNRH